MSTNEPLVKLQAAGQASILSYNVPDPTSYSGRFNLGLKFPLSPNGDTIFKKRVLQKQVVNQADTGTGLIPMTANFRRFVVLQKINDTGTPANSDSGASGGTGGEVVVRVPSMYITVGSSYAGAGDALPIQLIAHSRDDVSSVEPTAVRFLIHKPDGQSELIDANKSTSELGIWKATYRATASGTYVAKITADFVNSRGTNSTWSSAASSHFDVSITPGQNIDTSPPQINVLSGSGETLTLNQQGVAQLNLDFQVVEDLGAPTIDILLDDVQDTTTALQNMPGAVKRYTTNITMAGVHLVKIRAKNSANLVSTHEIQIQVKPYGTVDSQQALVLIYEVCLSNFLGSYGAGRTIQTFSLLPGEKTKISIKTYQSTTTTATEAKSIMDGYDESTASELNDAVSSETGTKSNDTEHLEAAAKVSASGSWGFASAHVEASVSGGSTAAMEQFSKNLTNAVSKHTASKSAKRQATVNFSSSNTNTSGSESVIERTIENINVSRTLNFVFRQLNQEFVSILHLCDVRLAHISDNPDYSPLTSNATENQKSRWVVNEVPLAEMDGLLKDVIDPSRYDEVRKGIITQLESIRDYKGEVTPAVETIEGLRPMKDSAGVNLYDNSDPQNPRLRTEPDGSLYTRFRNLTQLYQDEVSGNAFKVEGIILKVTKNALRSDGVIVEALLGQANALDDYSTDLQAQTIRQRTLQNDALEQGVKKDALGRQVIEAITADKQAEAFSKVFYPPAQSENPAP